MGPLPWAAVVYWTAAAGLALYGFYYGGIVALRAASPAPPTRPPAAGAAFVTLQVPLRDEAYVVRRVLDAAARIRWPLDRFEVQVLDDSTDDTTREAQAAVHRMREQGIAATYHHRKDPQGFKAGALNEGLRRARGEFVAILDADFVPPPGFIELLMPYFEDDEIACVQTRWDHLNEPYSTLTRSIALGLDAHFAVEQRVRVDRGFLLSFNATACIWRRATLNALGGWPTDTLTEDLDLTIRARLDGHRFVYVEQPRVPCEVPVEVLGFARQQERWAHGSAQNLRLHATAVVRACTLTRWQKTDALFHLAHYAFQPLVFMLFVAHVAFAYLDSAPHRPTAAAFGVLAAFGPLLLLADGQRRTHPRRFLIRLRTIVPLSLLGIGISFRVSLALLRGLAGRPLAFTRTPKFRILGKEGTWHGTRYVPRPDAITWLEGVLAAVAAAAAIHAAGRTNWVMATSLVVFGLSFASVFLASVLEGRFGGAMRRPDDPS